jgi:hypothetical protein
MSFLTSEKSGSGADGSMGALNGARENDWCGEVIPEVDLPAMYGHCAVTTDAERSNKQTHCLRFICRRDSDCVNEGDGRGSSTLSVENSSKLFFLVKIG